jgi:hypothetical protein
MTSQYTHRYSLASRVVNAALQLSTIALAGAVFVLGVILIWSES